MGTEDVARRTEILRPWAYNHRTSRVTIRGESAGAEDFDTWARPLLREIVDAVLEGRDRSSLRALDLGCLEGHNTDVLCEAGFGEVVGLDISQGHLERAEFLLKTLKNHQNVRLIQGNATDLSLLSGLGSFDLILFHGLLYHLKDPLRGFDALEMVGAPEHTVLLQTQYKGGYWAVVSPAAIAELQLKPLEPTSDDEKLLSSPKDGSVFERCSLRLNPAAVHHALNSYGYRGQIAYDTPSGYSYSFHSNLILTSNPEVLMTRLRRSVSVKGCHFYVWNGRSTNAYAFDKKPKAIAVRFILRVLYGQFLRRANARFLGRG